MTKQSDDQLSEQETAKRMEAALKRALSTPHKAHSKEKEGRAPASRRAPSKKS